MWMKSGLLKWGHYLTGGQLFDMDISVMFTIID